tara:strand:- start:19568 stop:21184 length:1617 start_codon:yes stop_codon:yes gene_type:complete
MNAPTHFPVIEDGSAPTLPESYAADPEGILLGYQRRVLELLSTTALLVIEKSRRIGLTWALASQAVLTSSMARSAGGMDTLYIGYNLDMAREFIDTAGMWAKSFNEAAGEIQEFMFEDGKDPEQHIKAFRITFASGYEIMALSSKPRSLRGRQGFVIIDEAAFHDDLEELLKAALALLIWGGKVCVVSTHDGAENPFNELVGELRAKKRAGKVFRVDFDEALADGLYNRICLVTGRDWSEEAQVKWRQEVIDFYGDAAQEELFCVPRRGGGQPLTRALIEANMVDVPVLRWACEDGFALKDASVRTAEARDWFEAMVLEHLEALSPDRPSFFGEDFGRVSDLTVIWPLQLAQNMKRHTPFTIELRNVPFEQQRQILFYTVGLLPRFQRGAMDAGGNGAYLAEVAWQKFGARRIEKISLSRGWYQDNMPPFVAAFEDRAIDVPRDRDTMDDLRSLREIAGVIQVPTLRTKGSDRLTRHGDSAIAGALAYYASCSEITEYDYQPAPLPGRSMPARRERLIDDSRDYEDDTPASAWNKGAF